MKTGLSDRTKLMLSMVIFGTIGIVRKQIPFPSSAIAFVRGLVGMLFLVAVMLLGKRKTIKSGKTEGTDRDMDGSSSVIEAFRKNAVLLIASGALLGFNWIFLFEAYRYTSVSVATICYYMAPVFVILVSPVVLREKITLKKGLCAFVSVCGMVLVSEVLETGFRGMQGVIFGLIAAVMYAAVILSNKFIKEMTANDRTVFQLGIAAAALLPYVLLTEDVSALKVTPSVIVLLAVAGIVHTGIAYTLYFGSIGSVPAQTVALFSYIDPVVAVILSVLVLGEKMSMLSLVGVILVLGATIISETEGIFRGKR